MTCLDSTAVESVAVFPAYNDLPESPLYCLASYIDFRQRNQATLSSAFEFPSGALPEPLWRTLP